MSGEDTHLGVGHPERRSKDLSKAHVRQVPLGRLTDGYGEGRFVVAHHSFFLCRGYGMDTNIHRPLQYFEHLVSHAASRTLVSCVTVVVSV